MSIEITNKKRKEQILESNNNSVTAKSKWIWPCPGCDLLNIDDQFTKHAKYRECEHCHKDIMVILPY